MTESNPYQAPTATDPLTPAQALTISKLASGQKLIIYSILLYFGAIVLQFAIGPIAALLLLVTLVTGIIGLVRLAAGFGFSVVKTVLLIIVMIIPLVGLIVLLVLNGKATAELRRSGYKVGLLGATKQA